MTGRRSLSFYIGQGTSRVNACVILACLVQLQRHNMVVLCAGIPQGITCDAGTVHVGQKASVTCKFPMDVGADKGAVIVERLPRNASEKTIRKDTLMCSWVEKHQTYDCYVAKGYTFDGAITRNLTVVIPYFSEEYAGTYICFLVSREEIQSEKCELMTTEHNSNSPATTTAHGTIRHSRETDGSSYMWVIALLVVISVVSLAVTAFLLVKRRMARTRSIRRRQQPNVIMYPVPTEPLIRQQPESKIVETHLKYFKLSAVNCQHVEDCMDEEMNKCLTDNIDTGIMQPPVFLRALPKGKENGVFIVVDISGIVLKIHHVKLRDSQPDILLKSYQIPLTVRLRTGIELFDFIADSVQTFLHETQLSNTAQLQCVAFVVPFPCKYEANLTSARLIKFTGGFQCNDVVGKDVKDLLQQAFDRKIPTCRLDATVFMDAAAATLMSVPDNNPSCRIAVTLDNGFHACYVEENDKMSRNTDEESMVLVNADLGALGENGCLDMFRTEYDKDLDKYSIHSQKQILEKMVSMAYMGEILRLVLADFARKQLLFKSVPKTCALDEKDCVTDDFVSLILSDNCNQYVNTNYVLRQLQLENCTEEDCKDVYCICYTIVKRAADLAAAALSAFIHRLGATDEVTIVIDGALKRSHLQFHQLLCDKTKKLVNPKKDCGRSPLHAGSA